MAIYHAAVRQELGSEAGREGICERGSEAAADATVDGKDGSGAAWRKPNIELVSLTARGYEVFGQRGLDFAPARNGDACYLKNVSPRLRDRVLGKKT